MNKQRINRIDHILENISLVLNACYVSVAVQRTPPPAEPFKEPESDADPSEPQILSAPEDDYTSFTLHQLSLNNDNSSPPRIRYSPPQIKKTSPRTPRLSPPESYSSPPLSLNSEPENRITTSTPYSRSQSNLEQIFKSRDRDNIKIANHTNKSPPKYDLQRLSCKDVPEKRTLNHNNNNNNNGIKHSVSEANINSHFTRYTRSRKNSFSNTTSNVQSSRYHQSAQSNRNSSISNLSRIPNPVPNKLNDDHNFKRPEVLNKPSPKYASSPDEPMFKKPDPPKPLNLKHEDYSYKRSDPVDIQITAGPSPKQKLSPEYERTAFVPTPSDRPIGLDLEEFLPVSFLFLISFFFTQKIKARPLKASHAYLMKLASMYFFFNNQCGILMIFIESATSVK